MRTLAVALALAMMAAPATACTTQPAPGLEKDLSTCGAAESALRDMVIEVDPLPETGPPSERPQVDPPPLPLPPANNPTQ